MIQLTDVGVIKRYIAEEVLDGYSGRVATAIQNDGGEFVKYEDYAALEASMTGVISGAQLELEDERKKRLAAESRVAELEKDAARYRWLRTYAEVEIPQSWLAHNSLYRDDTAGTWDSVIDMAMRGREAWHTLRSKL